MKTIKNINKFIILFLISFSCKAQSPILPVYDNPNYAEVENAYYKDINNFQNQYSGTWLYSNGNTSLTLKLRKREMMHINGPLVNIYEDIVVGEYQYIENGVEKVNTLGNFEENYSEVEDYNLYSNGLQHKNAYPKCDECPDGEKRLRFTINEPSRRQTEGLSDDFIIRRFFNNGVEKLKVWFKRTDNGVIYNKDTKEFVDVEGFSLPYNEYVLIKQ